MKLFLKYLLPPFIIMGFLTLKTYLELNFIAPFNSGHIIIYLALLLGTFIFWALLDYFQEVTGMIMKENWIGRIIFILGVLAMIYLYKINGRI